MKINKKISTNKLVLAIMLAALLTIVPLSFYGNNAESATTMTSYVDEKGVVFTNEVATVLVGNEGMLTTGLYYADSTYLSGVTADIYGDVIIIIGSGQKLTSSKTLFNITPGSTLRLFTEAGGAMGAAEVNTSEGAIKIDNGTLINTAKISSSFNSVSITGKGGIVDNYGIIENTGNKSAGITAKVLESVKITNFANGVIKGSRYGVDIVSADGNSTISNYGMIRGSTASESYGIQSKTVVTVYNYKDALIQGGSHGISLSAGGKIDNNGTVKAHESTLWSNCIVGSGFIEVINRENGMIYGLVYSIRLLGGGSVDNYGQIIGTGPSWGYGIYVDTPITINNYEGGYIFGLGNGIYICEYISAGRTVINNSGLIEGAAGVFADTNTSAKITNNKTGVIRALTYNGVWFPAGGEIYNNGLITGATRAIGASGAANPVILVNAGVLDGFVRLADAVNVVTFIRGSEINGNFTIGSNPASTLTFVGAAKLDASLTYSKVTGEADVGNAVITFDDTELPSWAIDKTIVLIDAGSVNTPDQEYKDFVIHVRGFQLVADHLEISVVPPHEKHYFITATSDKNSAISPAGVIDILKGEKITFVFEAKNGYTLMGVKVDGKMLSQEQIDKGSYTFSDVNMNHSIEVWSTGAKLLEIVVVEGDGHVDFSMNGRSFQTYTHPILIPEHADISLIACGHNGYLFKEWNTATKTLTTTKISFDDVTYSIYIEVSFTKDAAAFGPVSEEDSKYVIGGIALLAGLLFFFLVYYRRSYEVVKVEGSARIIGKERAKWRRTYIFTIEGGPAGNVSYSIGDKEDKVWKALSPNEDNEYFIPKCDVVGKITIRCG